jgi:hypothetical protein
MEVCGERIAIHPSIAGRVGSLLQKVYTTTRDTT